MPKSLWTVIPNTDGRKWELKHKGVVLGTIFRKPNHPKVHHGRDKFSLYVSSPKVYNHFAEVSKTHLFDTFDEAAQAFDDLSREQVLPWAKAVIEYFEELK